MNTAAAGVGGGGFQAAGTRGGCLVVLTRTSELRDADLRLILCSVFLIALSYSCLSNGLDADLRAYTLAIFMSHILYTLFFMCLVTQSL